MNSIQGSIANRFVERLRLNDFIKFNPKIDIVSVVENDNKEMYESWKSKAEGKRVLSLYHATDKLSNYQSIMKHGFYIGSACNKGYGVYLANHGRYSSFWAGGKYVLHCDVIYDKEKVKRYRSEVECSLYDSEYVVTDPSLIFPRYLINYKLDIHRDYVKEHRLYVKHGEFGCEKCDPVNEYGYSRRCDCAFDEPDVKD
jgi:hypothetical protein